MNTVPGRVAYPAVMNTVPGRVAYPAVMNTAPDNECAAIFFSSVDRDSEASSIVDDMFHEWVVRFAAFKSGWRSFFLTGANKSKTEMTASVQENISKHTIGLNMNAFQYRPDETMCEFSAFVAFNKATTGKTDIKHEMGKRP